MKKNSNKCLLFLKTTEEKVSVTKAVKIKHDDVVSGQSWEKNFHPSAL